MVDTNEQSKILDILYEQVQNYYYSVDLEI